MQHRFHVPDDQSPGLPTAGPGPAAFVPLPCLMSPGLVVAAPAFVAAVYQAARAMAAAPARPVRRPVPTFSRN